MMNYRDFLLAKRELAPDQGFEVEASELHPGLHPHQVDIVRWACRGGRRGIFASFGLGKTMIQIETMRLCLGRLGDDASALIVAPLGARREFFADADTLGYDRPVFVRRDAEVDAPGLYITNYESVRDGKLSASLFGAVTLDEAAILRGFGGTKTFRECMRLLAGDDRNTGVNSGGLRYRFVATATPSPNEHLELVSYAAFLGVMDVGAAKTRFFRRDSTRADRLTLLPHREAAFWQWVSTWACFVERPSDLGHSDDGYVLPELDVVWHEIPSTSKPAPERSGQGRIIADASMGVTAAAREKRASLEARVALVAEIMAEAPHERFVLWHDLEDERRALEQLRGVAAVYGTQDLEERERLVSAFAEGTAEFRHLAAKPVMLGSGCNLQRHCHRAIFTGIGFKFNDFIQAIHRLQRFLQPRRVRVDLIHTEAERGVRDTLMAKWERHAETVAKMTALIRSQGLSRGPGDALHRALGVERTEVAGDGYVLIRNDAVAEVAAMPSDSVDLVVTSIPFGTQYEYSPQLEDMGHTRDNDHFWQNMGFLTPELLRVVKPGRVAAIHVKDRITPGGVNGLGFQTVDPFSDQCVQHFRDHGWAFLGRITVVTDVVRENNQTYRLGWTEQCKDGSKMGAGLPEYVLLFRRPPTDRSNGYADEPVVKPKPDVVIEATGERSTWRRNGARMIPGTGYSRSRWQIDAHGFWRSSGDRPLTAEDIRELPHREIFQLYRAHSLGSVHDHEAHVSLGEGLEAAHRLPVGFMLLQPQSWHPEVWTDVMRAQTLNVRQGAKGRAHHLCPMQFDIADRLIGRYSAPGEVVMDPFGGLMTVPYCAVQLGRQGWGVELAEDYFLDGVAYVEGAAQERATPTLFDLVEWAEVAP